MAQSAAIIAGRAGRVCAECKGPIPETVNGRAKTCSHACGVNYQNRRRQEGKRAAWLAKKPACGSCGNVIPEERHAGSKYCSPACKKRVMDARWRERSPGYMRQYLYGLTPESYAEMLAEQDGRCAICRTDEPGGRGGWHVDHAHGTGEVRGLLCHHCNLALGNFKDDPARLRAAAIYLESSAARTIAP